MAGFCHSSRGALSQMLSTVVVLVVVVVAGASGAGVVAASGVEFEARIVGSGGVEASSGSVPSVPDSSGSGAILSTATGVALATTVVSGAAFCGVAASDKSSGVALRIVVFGAGAEGGLGTIAASRPGPSLWSVVGLSAVDSATVGAAATISIAFSRTVSLTASFASSNAVSTAADTTVSTFSVTGWGRSWLKTFAIAPTTAAPLFESVAVDAAVLAVVVAAIVSGSVNVVATIAIIAERDGWFFSAGSIDPAVDAAAAAPTVVKDLLAFVRAAISELPSEDASVEAAVGDGGACAVVTVFFAIVLAPRPGLSSGRTSIVDTVAVALVVVGIVASECAVAPGGIASEPETAVLVASVGDAAVVVCVVVVAAVAVVSGALSRLALSVSDVAASVIAAVVFRVNGLASASMFVFALASSVGVAVADAVAVFVNTGVWFATRLVSASGIASASASASSAFDADADAMVACVLATGDRLVDSPGLVSSSGIDSRFGASACSVVASARSVDVVCWFSLPFASKLPLPESVAVPFFSASGAEASAVSVDGGWISRSEGDSMVLVPLSPPVFAFAFVLLVLVVATAFARTLRSIVVGCSRPMVSR